MKETFEYGGIIWEVVATDRPAVAGEWVRHLGSCYLIQSGGTIFAMAEIVQPIWTLADWERWDGEKVVSAS